MMISRTLQHFYTISIADFKTLLKQQWSTSSALSSENQQKKNESNIRKPHKRMTA